MDGCNDPTPRFILGIESVCIVSFVRRATLRNKVNQLIRQLSMNDI